MACAGGMVCCRRQGADEVKIYPHIVLLFGMVGLYIGLENLLAYFARRVRFHLWVGLMGLCAAPYCVASFAMYSAADTAAGSQWQRWQLVFAGFLADWLALLGLDYLGKLKRIHLIVIGALTALLDLSLAIPGFGVTGKPAVKVIGWLGVTYNEMELGLLPQLFFGLAVVSMSWVVVAVIRRARRGSWGDYVFATAFLLWLLGAANDTGVAAGLYRGVYVVEYTFVLMAALFAGLLFGQMHRLSREAEEQSRRLAVEAMVKDRRLAAAQGELMESAKLAAVGRLAAGVAHEVNNPLTYVLTNLQELSEELPPEGELRTLAEEALHGAGRIRKLVLQLSAFAHPSDAARSASVRAAVETAAKLASVEIKDRATLELDIAELPNVAMEEARLAQVLLNLLVNAAQAIPAGRRAENRIRVRASVDERDDTVLISVEDTGSGIPTEALPNLFEPFFTTKPVGAGTGLGLAISKELVSKAGGTMRAENVAPHGAHFTIELPIGSDLHAPATAKDRAHRSVPAPAVDANAGRPSLLLVDDEPAVLRSLSRTLESAFVVHAVQSGAKAKALVSAGNDFDLILCDLMMPEGSALDLLDWLLDTRPELARKLIVMTGGGSERQAQATTHRAKPRLLPKPFTLPDLLALLEPTPGR